MGALVTGRRGGGRRRTTLGRPKLVRSGLVAALVGAALALVPVAAPSTAAATGPIVPIPADAETQPVANSGDAADDPALWRNPVDPSASLLIGNNKLGALEVYNLDGSRRQRLTTSTRFWGNVDVRQGVSVNGASRDVVAAYNNGLRMFSVDPTSLQLVPSTEGTGAIPTGGGEGLCLYSSPTTGHLHAFVITIQGRVRQYRIGDLDSDGLLDASLVREFQVGSEAEGCVADDDNSALYISEENVGLWRYGAEPDTGSSRTFVDGDAPPGNLAEDVEGVTVVDLPDGSGYVLASAQNVASPLNSYFVAYTRATNAYVGSFRVATGSLADGCSRTDGITAVAADLGPAFPEGIFVCQDDANTSPGTSGNQNFKMVRLEKILSLWSSGPPNAAPSASFEVLSCDGPTCEFDTSGSTDSDGTIESYAWSFGDGTVGSGPTVSHTYLTPGPFTVTLRVTDDGGASGTTTRQADPAVPLPPVAPISFVGAASTNGNRTSHQVTVPSAVQAGDTLVAFFVSNTSAAITGPPGWALLNSVGDSSVSGRAWTRTATTGDAGSTLRVSTPTYAKSDLTIVAYRGADTPAVTVSAARLDLSVSSAHTTPAVSTSRSAWVVSYWADKSSSSIPLTPPVAVSTRASSSGSGGGLITALLADSGAAVAPGNVGSLIATGTPSPSRKVTFTTLINARPETPA